MGIDYTVQIFLYCIICCVCIGLMGRLCCDGTVSVHRLNNSADLSALFLWGDGTETHQQT